MVKQPTDTHLLYFVFCIVYLVRFQNLIENYQISLLSTQPLMPRAPLSLLLLKLSYCLPPSFLLLSSPLHVC